MPFLAAYATAGVVTSDKISIGNVTLNILAVTFILDLDDMSATFFLTPHERNKVEKYFTTIMDDHNEWKTSLIEICWTRLVSITAVILLLVHVTHYAYQDCGFEFASAYDYASYTALFLQAVGVFVTSNWNFGLLF